MRNEDLASQVYTAPSFSLHPRRITQDLSARRKLRAPAEAAAAADPARRRGCWRRWLRATARGRTTLNRATQFGDGRAGGSLRGEA